MVVIKRVSVLWECFKKRKTTDYNYEPQNSFTLKFPKIKWVKWSLFSPVLWLELMDFCQSYGTERQKIFYNEVI